MTEYTLPAENSIAAVITGAELFGVLQSSAYKQAKLSDFLTYAESAPTVTSATFTGTNLFGEGANFAGLVNISNSGLSTLIGATLTSKVGFFGAAGTSQRTSGAQVTMTVSTFSAIGSGTVGFTSTTMASQLWAQIAEVRQTLVDLGVWKGS